MDINEITEKILKVVSQADYTKGLNYNENYIEYMGVSTVSNQKRYQFLVRSERESTKYLVQIVCKNSQIIDTYCSCPRFRQADSCKHVAAALTSYSNKIFSFQKENHFQATKQLIEKMTKEFSEKTEKKIEVHVVPALIKHHGYYYDEVFLKVKIGLDKMYSLLGKYGSFANAFEKEEEFYFGSNFTYDPKKHFFSERSLNLFRIIDQLRYRRYNSGNTISLDDSAVKSILKLYPDGFCVGENAVSTEMKNIFPFPLSLSRENDVYELNFEGDFEDIDRYTDDYEYVYFAPYMYHLTKKQRFLLKECMKEHLYKLEFPLEDFADFQKVLFPMVKDALRLDESVSDIIMVSNPEVKLYFDLNEEDIVCHPKFIYQNEEIGYFEKKENIIRDTEFEENLIDEILSYGFVKKTDCLLLEDFDFICEFLDHSLEELSQKYSVFTSEQLKNTHLLKNNSVSTHFTIGKDQILHYDFQLTGVDSSELDDILKSLRNKKKYFRLKSGNILSLEQKDLEELKDLTDELELSLSGGEIPKYRALYLDSIKEKKYHIIETDSSFQTFIHRFLEYQNVDLSFTEEELKVLRDYQISGVKWLYMICKCDFGGILADEMGLGKSLQTILLLKKLLMEQKDAKFLIVCPTSLVYNWENEILKFAPELNYQVFMGNRLDRRSALNRFKGNIYITSYGLLREDLEFYQQISFRVFTIDEAQNIKNPKTGLTKAVKSITSQTKIALTGTPIENSIIELWSIFDFIMPGFLSNLMKFRTKYRINEDFDMETNRLLAHLKEQVKPFILRRKKKDVVKDLPDKIENNIYIDLTDEQKKIYAAEVHTVREEMDELVRSGGFTRNKMLILTLLTKLRQICIAPSLVIENYEGESSKIENLMKIIKEVIQNGHKILLFTSFKKALELVRSRLDEESISSYTIAGDVPGKQRQILVDAFNKDNTNVFLIMLKSGGTGLNLTSADVVIHLDLWWNPQAENQATDRTHRIGQTKNVEVIKLICKGTIEEKILKLQEKKKILSDKMIENDMDDSTYLQQLTEQDIRDLLAYENKDSI